MSNSKIIIILAVAFYIFSYYRTPFVYAGLFAQLAYLFSRGVELSRLPLVGPHDTLFFLSASVVLFGMPVASQIENRKSVLNSLTAFSLFFIFLSVLYKPHNSPLPPVLRTFWFETHVAFSFFSYALFCIAAVLGVLFLVRKEEKNELLQYKAILVGYCLFSLAMVLGGVWAYLAWGTYWVWTPKELWTVILWLFYSFYLHARPRKWWAGKASAVLGIIGFLIMMFTYMGVSLFMKSSHAF